MNRINVKQISGVEFSVFNNDGKEILVIDAMDINELSQKPIECMTMEEITNVIDECWDVEISGILQ